MKRVILATALAVGSILFTGRPALAQMHHDAGNRLEII
jgi:hypothetical protein